MRPSEILERSRAAALRIREIDAEIRALHDKIGVQGHSYGFHGKNDIRDPMRRVDEMIDGTMDLEVEKMECRRDINAALRIIDGMRVVDTSSTGKFTTDAEYILSEYYVFAKSMGEIARGAGQPAELCTMLLRENVKFCDSVGCAGLLAASHRREDA